VRPPQACTPPSYVCVPWALLSPLRLIFIPWRFNYAPWGSFMPSRAQVHAPPRHVHPSPDVYAPPGGKGAPPPMYAPPPSQVMRAPSLLCAPPHCRLRPHLPHLRPLDLLEVLPWKSTSPFPMPCQPIVLTGGKM
jgi:hypothetical protein